MQSARLHSWQRKTDNFDTVLAKFDNYFEPKRNVIHERAFFH